LLVRVLSEGFQTDIKRISWVCKIQVYMAAWCQWVSMTLICLTTIDQCVSMSTYRHYSTKRLAKRAIVLTCIFWGLYCICFLIYYDVPSGRCTIINPTFAIYTTLVHFPDLRGFLP
jgi:Na+/proline symporter